ncbi:MAG: PfkB domain protein [Thermotoga sp. 50_1627]|uniref:carbohydrate kinase family protein n=1 Tax=Pseudothermotoga sp. TaxID=2033661 RepID=UPI00076BFDA9|nr:MAG: PfkB domain protein [Thermotoga sp. 50_64]KUK25654.1 MAG: PfkB domain protein [Thermotoga sp. 50_1627]MBC7115566.1 bifunctional hydroxymethylpyrimidine kinase/phosphomethylpyrimidine kinase [Pseudothermotoga sp.]MDK2923684.1 ribokinase [Pseudothermotoga sp.]HBT40015.1 ribokinase [Pseudothermotoga sp.]
MSVTVFGKINIDTFLYIDRIRVGENHLCTKTFTDIGGKGANTAIALAKLSVPCELVAMIGNDSISQAVLKRLKKYGIDIGSIKVCEEQIGKTFVVVESDGRNTMFHILGANAHLTPDKIDWTFLETCNAVFVQMGIPSETAQEVIMMSKRNGKYVFVDPAGFSEMIDLQTLAYADTVAPNEIELLKMTKENEIEKAVKKLLGVGVEEVVVKLGRKGATLYTEKMSYHVDAHNVEVVDTTGAGDAFNAAYMFAKLKKLDAKDSLKLAVAASALAVTKVGSSSASPTRDKLAEFLKLKGEERLAEVVLEGSV